MGYTYEGQSWCDLDAKSQRLFNIHVPDDDSKFSSGWLSKFKKRHGLKQVKKHGEAASADNAAIVKTIPELKEILKSYDLKDIFNMDETGLFYR